MVTRTTFRLGSLAATIVLSLALVSSASARPAGLSNTKSATVSQSDQGSGIRLHRSGLLVQHNVGNSLTAVPPIGPADRHGSLMAGTIPVTSVAAAQSSGFDWTDAAIGAVFGICLAMIAVYTTMAVRGRRGDFALRT